MRLIDVNDFLAKLKERHEYIMQDPELSKRMKWCEAVHYGETTEIIEKMPTIEATPVVHGRWMLEGSGHTHYCDRCHDYYTTDADSLYFCPRCGAKMIGVEQPGRNGWKMELVDGELKQVWGVIKERFVKTRTEEDFPNCGARMDKED